MAIAAIPLQPSARLVRELDWNLLRTFIVLAESRSVTEAAQKLRLAQPSVSTAWENGATG